METLNFAVDEPPNLAQSENGSCRGAVTYFIHHPKLVVWDHCGDSLTI
jgi:hypothetical protein